MSLIRTAPVLVTDLDGPCFARRFGQHTFRSPIWIALVSLPIRTTDGLLDLVEERFYCRFGRIPFRSPIPTGWGRPQGLPLIASGGRRWLATGRDNWWRVGIFGNWWGSLVAGRDRWRRLWDRWRRRRSLATGEERCDLRRSQGMGGDSWRQAEIAGDLRRSLVTSRDRW